ncbi:Protein of unknown function [Kaistia soli DSM 19436]|uniref:DUF2934 domain-containing protein n=1 Tax=Kaistia soli DSM 19436 TaxID=1122133 RepID=A0A1M4VLG1_9HYPH|nr:DUF2934 domain-containing protein [Kaistia soli]SHE69768.1 Protein of unknown function [Kaistia soli DSM 19436]
MASRDERIRERAYFLWQQAGAPAGRAEEFWQDAEQHESREGSDLPSAGPHARPDLINEDATIGSGMFPSPGDDDEGTAQPSG